MDQGEFGRGHTLGLTARKAHDSHYKNSLTVSAWRCIEICCCHCHGQVATEQQETRVRGQLCLEVRSPLPACCNQGIFVLNEISGFKTFAKGHTLTPHSRYSGLSEHVAWCTALLSCWDGRRRALSNSSPVKVLVSTDRGTFTTPVLSCRAGLSLWTEPLHHYLHFGCF